jgi:enoyl-CoA hydratase
MGFAGPDVREGVNSLRERRAPDFGSSDPWRGQPQPPSDRDPAADGRS